MLVQLKVEGMHCGGCARAVERALSGVEHVQSVDVKVDDGEALVRAGDGVDPSALVAAIKGAGYPARLASSQE
ncbi:heavy-metal-associated domain-containing protein [Arvimicrobium flavum]|uniref:heavy-metal-associated domain-containing protein n=1 Tax=Arvimicrobium flavum TaxID=3393320 RepID=UPI00237A7D59|nr:heavy metal-associated domain-containing protein [Mesorhizobium shangrilense]